MRTAGAHGRPRTARAHSLILAGVRNSESGVQRHAAARAATASAIATSFPHAGLRRLFIRASAAINVLARHDIRMGAAMSAPDYLARASRQLDALLREAAAQRRGADEILQPALERLRE